MATLQQIEEMEAYFQSMQIPVGTFRVKYGSIWLDQDYINNRIRLMKLGPDDQQSRDFYDQLLEVRQNLEIEKGN